MKARPPADDDKPESITVWFFKKIDTPLQGSKLLAEPSLKVPDKICQFIKVWLVDNADVKDWVWKEAEAAVRMTPVGYALKRLSALL